MKTIQDLKTDFQEKIEILKRTKDEIENLNNPIFKNAEKHISV